MKQYLVIAELENKGYIIGTRSDLMEAEDFSIQQFLSERSSTSYAVISEDDEAIPEIMFYAN